MIIKDVIMKNHFKRLFWIDKEETNDAKMKEQ